MTDLWDERKKALENQYFQKLEAEKIAQLREAKKEQLIRECCLDRCPKCGEPLEKMIFREVPLDKCPDCGGVWLGPKDLQVLAEKDHRTWFQRWFQDEEDRKKG